MAKRTNSKAHSKGNAVSKPRKPYEDFPLTWHPSGYWCKKIRGKVHYFGGRHADPEEALDAYLEVKDDLLAGRDPARSSSALTVRDGVNEFLADRKHRVEAGDLTQRSFDDYYATCKRVIDAFGKSRRVESLGPNDFLGLKHDLGKNRGPVSVGNEVARVRVLFNYLWVAGLIDKPPRLGPTFKRPSRKVLRQVPSKNGERMLEPADIRSLLKTARDQLKAMILLGVNCGFGNSDCAQLPRSAVDHSTGWVNFPRRKTGVERRCPLWPETLDALRGVEASRPEPLAAEHEDLVFITKSGNPWFKKTSDNPVTKEFRKLLVKQGLHRPGLGFYTLRHVFETIALECRDQVAVDYLMGHTRHDMASAYREQISDERLQAATDHIRKWLTLSDDNRTKSSN